jgi:acyl carrier protein
MINSIYSKKLEKLFEIDFTDGIEDKNIEWDSLIIISFMAFLTEEFNKSETPEKIESLQKYRDLFLYINNLSKK